MNKTSGKLQACFGGLLWVFPIVISNYSPDVRASSIGPISASHLLANGAVAVLRTFATGQPRYCTVMLPIPWPKTRKSWALFTPDKVWFLSAQFVASKRYFLRRSPQPFPFLPFFYTPLSAAYSAVSKSYFLMSPGPTRPWYIMTHRCWGRPTLLYTLHVLNAFPLHTSILLWGGTLTSPIRCQILNCEVVVFLNKLWLC